MLNPRWACGTVSYTADHGTRQFKRLCAPAGSAPSLCRLCDSAPRASETAKAVVRVAGAARLRSGRSDHALGRRAVIACRRKRSCGGGCWDGSFWAKAVVWPLAVFANCWRSEAIVSKRSGISPDLRQRLRERAESANAQRFPLVQSGRSGSLAGADSQAAEIPQRRHCARLASAFGRKRARARCRDHAAKGAVHGRVMRGTRFQRSAGLSGGVIYGLALRWHHGCRDS